MPTTAAPIATEAQFVFLGDLLHIDGEAWEVEATGPAESTTVAGPGAVALIVRRHCTDYRVRYVLPPTKEVDVVPAYAWTRA